MSLMRKIAGFLRFMFLVFIDLPLRREANRERAFDIQGGYVLLGLCIFLFAFHTEPYIPPSRFPDLSQLDVIEGVLVNHPTRRDGKYTTAPIGIQTHGGDVFKECAVLGVRCLTEEATPKQWQDYVGKPARMWFRGDWVIQLEIDGRIMISHEKTKRYMTSWPGIYYIGLLIISYLVFRLISRYGRAALLEAFGRTSATGDGVN